MSVEISLGIFLGQLSKTYLIIVNDHIINET